MEGRGDMSEKGRRICAAISTVALLMMVVFFFIIVRYRPWIGDDVLHCFTGGLSYYVYPDRPVKEQYLGEYFCSFSQAFSHMKEYYMKWGGRLLTGIVDPILVIGGNKISAIVTVMTYIGILLLGLRLVYEDIKNVMYHPISVICVGAILLFYNSTMDYNIMRVMVDLYGFSFLLYLGLVNLNEECLKMKGVPSKKFTILMNIVGFLAGVTHELLGAWFIFQILFGTALRKKNIKEFVVCCRNLIGTFTGYAICLLAPGNFQRAKNPHEAWVHGSVVERLINSVKEHYLVITSYEAVGKYIFAGMILASIIAFIFLCIKKEYKYLVWIVEKEIYVIVSIILWGVISGAKSRGLYGAMLYSLLVMIRVMYEAEKVLGNKQYVFEILSVMLFVAVLCDCISWIPTMALQASNREKIIKEAVENSEPEVCVRRFSEECNRNIFFLEYVDSQQELDWFYYARMYGVHVVLEE